MKIKAGQEVLNILAIAYKANRPVILEGTHGVGKSELIAQAAKHLGIDCIVRDLSLMEPPDLLGLPYQKNGVTVYAPPKFLPTSGCGFLVFEELNRSERYMRSPCLQLLTARMLNDYALPPGWLPMAAVNPDGSGYDVQELDPALLSRFVRVGVVADAASWLEWAQNNQIHGAVLQYVTSVPKIFESTNPRSWTYVSEVLSAYEAAGGDDPQTLLAMTDGLVGPTHAQAFNKIFRGGGNVTVNVEQILRKYSDVRKTIVHWIKAKKTDLLDSVAHRVQVALQDSDLCVKISQSKIMARNLAGFIKDLPADMGRKVSLSARNGGAL